MKLDGWFTSTRVFYALVALLVMIVVAGWLGIGLTLEQKDLEIETLRNQLEKALETQTGGAEIDPPPISETTARFRFPIAESDYMELTSPFGYRVSPVLHVERYHTGLDIAATWRAQVVAIADGVVTEHWPPPNGYFRGHPTYGGLVVVEHADGWQSLYAHLSWSRVHTGQQVQSGEVIGRVGGTGKADGEHLHLELTDPGGDVMNPELYLEMP